MFQRHILWCLVLVGIQASAGNCARGESAIPSLSGFDRARIEATYPPTEDDRAGELAKLLYRLKSLDSNRLRELAGSSESAHVGDVVQWSGEVTKEIAIRIPGELSEYLEFSVIHFLEVRDADRAMRVFSSTLPPNLSTGDRIDASGVVLNVAAPDDTGLGVPQAIATNSIGWYPKQHQNPGQELLSDNGFDIGLLGSLNTRNRMPMTSDDAEAFYTLLGIAGAAGFADSAPPANEVSSVTMLQDPTKVTGDWVHLDLDTVQITRIEVSDPKRRQQLGSDHYFQIDAMADLGNVAIKVERPGKEPGQKLPPAIFQNRYPVSLAAREIPPFLQEEMSSSSGNETVVTSVRIRCGVDGFFFRLWGYDSDFMNQRSGAQQFGPLIIASRITNLEPTTADPIGVGVIGTIAATLILTTMAAIWWWQRCAWAGDDAAMRRRKRHQSDQIQLPDGGNV